jgi:hypothetical protein
MARLIVQVEGVTEEEFVNALLAPHLVVRGWESVAAIRMGRARSRDRRHGVKGWDVVLPSILKHLKQDAGCCVTTLVDYYGLPATGPRAWPGREEADRLPIAKRGAWVQHALERAVAEALGHAYAARRFLPFVIMHEFEGLLFSDCGRFADAIGQPDLAGSFQKIRDAFVTPEEINDSPLTAPSKRVETLLPGYAKPLMGPLAALGIGLETIRRECPHFRAWIGQLEQWVQHG